jgi:acyl-CoA thioesterase-1
VIELFAYGTLRDASYREALFDRILPTRPATLAGWRAVVETGGYLTIVRAPGETLRGELLSLDDAALAVADAWEEVPLYERLRVEAQAEGAAVPCWVYVRPTASDDRAPEGMLARHDRATVLAQIRAFRLSRE